MKFIQNFFWQTMALTFNTTKYLSQTHTWGPSLSRLILLFTWLNSLTSPWQKLGEGSEQKSLERKFSLFNLISTFLLVKHKERFGSLSVGIHFFLFCTWYNLFLFYFYYYYLIFIYLEVHSCYKVKLG